MDRLQIKDKVVSPCQTTTSMFYNYFIVSKHLHVARLTDMHGQMSSALYQKLIYCTSLLHSFFSLFEVIWTKFKGYVYSNKKKARKVWEKFEYRQKVKERVVKCTMVKTPPVKGDKNLQHRRQEFESVSFMRVRFLWVCTKNTYFGKTLD